MSPSDSHENRMRGILLMLSTMLCFIILDAIMKPARDLFPCAGPWARFFFATIIAPWSVAGILRSWQEAKRRETGTAIIAPDATTAVFNAGIRTTPLATATTIMFLSPLWVTLLSIPLLGEKVASPLAGMLLASPAPSSSSTWHSGFGGVGVGVLFCSSQLCSMPLPVGHPHGARG